MRTSLAVDLDGARIGPLETGEDLDQRALAGAVLAEKRHDFAAPQGEIDALQRVHRAVALDDTAHLQDDVVGCHGGLPHR